MQFGKRSSQRGPHSSEDHCHGYQQQGLLYRLDGTGHPRHRLFVHPGHSGWLTLVIAIVGLVLAIMGLKRNPAGQPGHGMAVAGLVLTIIALALAVIGIICVIGLCAAAGTIGALA